MQLSFHESFRLNGTEGYYTVLDIPVVNTKTGTGNQSCTRNSIVENIQQRIPIPRPLDKVNGQIVARFQGAYSNGGYQGNTTTVTGTVSGLTAAPPTTATSFGYREKSVSPLVCLVSSVIIIVSATCIL